MKKKIHFLESIQKTRVNSYHLIVYGHAMFIGNRQKEAIPVYHCRVDQTV